MNGEDYISSLRQNPPVSIALPSTAVIQSGGAAVEGIANRIGQYTSGKVVEDYVSDKILTPLRDAAVKFALLYAGMVFVIVGLLLLALNTTIGKTAASAATGGVSNLIQNAASGEKKSGKKK